MYQELYQYAKKYALVKQKNRAPRTICAYIVLSENGKYLRTEIINQKERTRTLCPERSGGNYDRPIICDKYQSIFCGEIEGKIIGNEKYHKGFMDIMKAGAETGVKCLDTIYQFLSNITADDFQKIYQTLTDARIKNGDYLSFRIGSQNVESMEEWVSWWDDTVCKKDVNESQEVAVSAITGEMVVPYKEKFPQIKSKQAGSGAPIYSTVPRGVSSDKLSSYVTYDAIGSQGSCIAEEEGLAITAAIESLLDNQNHHNNDFNLLWWYDDPNSDNVIEEQLLQNDEYSNDLKEELSISKQKLFWDKENHFHIMTFEFPAKGRVILSNYVKGSYDALTENARKWHNDCELMLHKYNIETGRMDNTVYQSLKPFAILRQTATHIENENWKAEHSRNTNKLIRAVLFGDQIPLDIVRRAQFQIRRIKATPGIKEKEKRSERVLLQIQKLFLNRTGKEMNIMTAALDKNTTNIGYVCGRYFAFICMAQKSAIKKSTLESKYYKLASTAPMKAFALLNPKVEAAYIERTKNPSFWRKIRDDILEKMPSNMPKTLTIEEQAAFMLGFSHQNADFFNKNDSANNNNEQEGE